jgi:hypothetical protein
MIYDPVVLPRDVAVSLIRLYNLYWNETGDHDPGKELTDKGFASLVNQTDYNLLEEACRAIEPYEAQLLELLLSSEEPETDPSPFTTPGHGG